MPPEIEKNEILETDIDFCNHFIPVPLCYQETLYTCGIACVQSILACYGIEFRQDILIEQLKQKPVISNRVLITI